LIGDFEAATTSCATQQADQQGLAAATRFGVADAPISVRRKLLLVSFELRPVDITFVMALEHDLPFLERLVVKAGAIIPH